MREILVALDARLIGARATGDSTYWTGLLHGLAAQNLNARFLLLSNAPKPQGIPQSPAFTWQTVPARSGRWWSLVTFPLVARKAKVDLLHTQYNFSPLAGRRVVTTVHDVSFLLNPEWFQPRDRFLLSRFVPRACQRAACVITVSETSRRDLEAKIPSARGKSRVTLLARSPLITPMPREAAQRRVRDELGQTAPYLLSVGTRWPRKNMMLAVRAVEALPSHLPHELLLTGKQGWGDDSVGSRTRATGYVSDELLSALYGAAEMYLVPSHYEGFGLTLLEAFACGCPVLSSNGGSLPEVAGSAAELLPPADPDHWAVTIERLLTDSSNLDRMRRAGRERESEFSWERTARETVDVYREVAE